jgi:murein DD-endopeptidase MepM/ murein hydrolase activator NlpD
MRITTVFLYSVATILVSIPAIQGVTIDYITAFENINDGVFWPVPEASPTDVSSTFGPRIRSSCDCYDFHRGIDIHGEIGDDVVATYGGSVKKKTVYNNGGLTLILEHSFTDWVKLHPDKKSTKRWYSLYMHLNDTLVEEGDEITAGQHIAAVGDSGSAAHAHLHHEVRVGTYCSLEWAVDNPSSTCNTKEYDPHVHPFLVYAQDLMGGTEVHFHSAIAVSGGADDGVVNVRTNDDAANVNKYVFQVKDSAGNTIKEHVLDLNLRIGFDATSTANIDTPDQSLPYLAPIPFGYSATVWEMNLTLPSGWVGCQEDGYVNVEAYDIWGEPADQIEVPIVC